MFSALESLLKFAIVKMTKDLNSNILENFLVSFSPMERWFTSIEQCVAVTFHM